MAIQWSAGALLDLSSVYWRSCVLQVAVKLKLFDALGCESLDAEDIALRTSTDRDACRRLLDVLAANGLLRKEGEGYSNSDEAIRWLCTGSDEYLGHIVMHHHHLMGSWARLDEAVRTGRPVDRPSGPGEQEMEAYLMGMFNTASLQAPDLVRQIDLAGRRRLLDLGGGPGTYAVHFCLANPQLSAVVFDLPEARPYAERVIGRFGLQERVAFMAGDFIEQEDLGGGYDVVWASHILHNEGPDVCRAIVAKAARSLEPGGVLLAHDFFLDDSGLGPFFPALFSLNMLVATERGKTYRQSDVVDMMERAGLIRIERLPYKGPSDSGVIRALKP
jgi:SAM-dependent methyltransferase